MTTVKIYNPRVTDSLFSFQRREATSFGSLWSMKKFKQSYAGLNCFLSWGEKISKPPIAPLLTAKRQILKLHSSTFTIPGWFKKIFTLSGDIKAMINSKNPLERSKSVKRIFFTSIDFTHSSIQLTECLNDVHLFDLAAYSTVLPRALTGTACIGNLILKVNDLYQNYSKSQEISGKAYPIRLWDRLKSDNNLVWKVLETMRNVLGVLSAILSLIIFFFALYLSPYWMLGISTFILVSSIAAEIHASL